MIKYTRKYLILIYLLKKDWTTKTVLAIAALDVCCISCKPREAVEKIQKF